MSKNTAFSNLTVLDMTRYLPGAYATQMLADLGAEVIKMEDTGQGDFCRHDYPFINDESYYFTALCRNKKSMSLNLKNEEAKEIFLKMAAKADIIVESFRVGVTKRLGVDYETIKAINPKVIYVSYSGYGQKDPRSLKALHDINMQGQCGYLSLNGGRTTPIHLCDASSAMVALQGMLAALYNREVTGEGSYVDVSMFDSFVWLNSMVDGRWFFNGKKQDAEDLEYPAVAYNIYQTKDNRQFTLGMVEEKFWRGFCEEFGLEDLITVGLSRRHEAPEAFEKVEALMASKTLDEWREWMADKDLPVGPVENKSDAIEEIVASDTGMMAYVDFPRTGPVLQTNIPHHFSNLKASLDDVTPPPVLGENNLEQLLKLGYTRQDAERLASEGAINAVID